MCNCYSHTRPEETGDDKQVIVFYPAGGKDVCLDFCISKEIIKLWGMGIETLNSCCGHNGVFDARPSLVVDKSFAKQTSEALKEIDPNRSWKVLHWDLIEFNSND